MNEKIIYLSIIFVLVLFAGAIAIIGPARVFAALGITVSQMIGGSSSASITANAVCDPSGNICNATATTMTGMRVPYGSTLKNLYAFQATAPASGSSCTFTIRKSAGCTSAYTSTGITCTIAGNGSLKTCSDTTHTAVISAGDCIQLYFSVSGKCSGYINWGFESNVAY